MDIMPEIMNGKNVADFIDPDIAEKLEALEREEEKLQEEGFYNSDGDMVSLLPPLTPTAQAIHPTPFSSTPTTNEKKRQHGSPSHIKSNRRASKSRNGISLDSRARLVCGH